MEENRLPKPGEIYLHFKDKPYQIITVATNTETNEPMVVYQALYGEFKMFVRPLASFLSEVDHEKYPEAEQKYRFEPRTLQESNIQDTALRPGAAERLGVAEGPGAAEKREAAARPGAAARLGAAERPGAAEKLATADKPETSGARNRTRIPEEETLMKTPEGEVNQLLMKFLDAPSFSKKLEVVSSNRKYLDDRLINDMAVALDCTVEEGPLDIRINGLLTCLQAMCRFENKRLR